MSDQRLSGGQELVGLTFNPSGDPRVIKAKQLCADLADLLEEDYITKANDEENKIHHLYGHLYDPTRFAILQAQMAVVKLLTLK